MPLRVLTLSTLYPDASRPNFGIFVERQTLGLAAHPDVELKVVAPIGLPPVPLSLHPRYRGLAGVPRRETWKGIDTWRPRFTTLPVMGGALNAQMLTRALNALVARIWQDFPFDVIDAEFFYPDAPAALAVSKAYGRPFSAKARGHDIHHWGRQPETRELVHNAGCMAGSMLAVSEAMRRDMALVGLPIERIRVHRTGVELDRFRPIDRAAAKAALGVAGPLIVSLGALIERKGHGVVIEAVSRLPGMTLIVAGAGPDERALTALAARLDVADRVRFLGSVAHDQLPGLLGAADVMALATASEGLANAWVEALACGVPVVTTDVGGARELLTDPAAGRLVERTPSAFAEAITAVLTDPPAPETVRALAAPYSWAANTDQLYRHLCAIVGRPPTA
jgi:teichuronic acid biosynthesis glycosyltransferase TuaC